VKDEQVWLRRRPDNGLLGGMLEAPSTPWRAQAWKAEAARAHAPVAATWEKRGTVHHGFTHFAIELQVWSACPNGRSPDDGAWCHVADFGRLALPTLTRKVIEAALQPPLSQPLRQPASARASPRIMAK
jgi:A/G-specific adenine glycosylase